MACGISSEFPGMPGRYGAVSRGLCAKSQTPGSLRNLVSCTEIVFAISLADLLERLRHSVKVSAAIIEHFIAFMFADVKTPSFVKRS